MKRILLALVIILIVSCSPRVITKTVVEHSTDTLVELRILHDTVKFDVPFIKEVNMTKDSTSHIENEYASSDASIEDGILHHSLETKPHTIYVPYETIVRDTVFREVYKEVTENTIEKKVSLWTRIKNDALLVLLTILGISALFIIYKLKK